MTLAQLLEDLKASYIKTLPDKRQAVAALVSKQDWAALEDEFHKMKGTGKTYGLPEISLLGEAMEMICHHRQEPLIDSLQRSLLILDWIHELRSRGDSPDPTASPDLQTLFSRRKPLA